VSDGSKVPNPKRAGTGVILRPATEQEVDVLSKVAFRSKAHSGYDDGFKEACRQELTVRREDLESHRLTVAVDENSGTILGFHGLVATNSDDAELSALFVVPERIGTGEGRLLFEDAVRRASAEGIGRFRIEADPFAAAFYRHVGADLTGTTSSHSIHDRELPLFHYYL
jgi:GNAT superfamily N-acetyltransferase